MTGVRSSWPTTFTNRRRARSRASSAASTSCSRSEVTTGATIRRRARSAGARHPRGPLPPYPRHRGRGRRLPRCRTRRRTGRSGAARCSGCSASAPPASCGAPRCRPGWRRVLRPVTINDQTGLTGLLPSTGRFRIYTVTGDAAEAERRRVPAHRRRPRSTDPPCSTSPTSASGSRRPSLTRDFQCVTGWRVADVPWQGVKLADLLDEVGVQPSATHVRFWSFDGVYTETLTLEQARRDDVLIAHRDAGQAGHPRARRAGAPLRGADVRLQVAQVARAHRGGRRPRRPHRPRLLGAPRLRRRRVGRARRTAAATTDPT